MINYDGYGFVMCPTSFPSPTQLHLTPPYPTTCTLTSPGTPSNTTTIPHQGSDATTLPQSGQNVSLSIASSLKTTVSGVGWGEGDYYHNGVGKGAAPGCLLGGGGGGQNCPTPTYFFRLQTFVQKIIMG